MVPFPGAPNGVGDAYIKQSVFPSRMANDLPATQAQVLAATQRPIATIALTQQTGVPAWQTIPSWDVVGTADHAIPPALQLAMANTAHAHITKVDASHLSMISHPDTVTTAGQRSGRGPRAAREGPSRVRRLAAALDLLHGRPRHRLGPRHRLRPRQLPGGGRLTSVLPPAPVPAPWTFSPMRGRRARRRVEDQPRR